MSTEKDQEGLGKNPETKALQKSKQQNSDEIDLIEVFLAIWKERLILYITLGVFAVVGLIIALTAVEEYTAEVKLLPEERQQQGPTSGLASQFGLGNLQAGRQEGIEARYYPDLAKSIPFIKPFLDHKIYVKELDDSLTIENYFNNYHSDFNFFGLLGPRKGSFKESNAGDKIGSGDSEESVNAMRKQKLNDLGIESLRPFREMEHTLDLTEKEFKAIKDFKERIEAEHSEDEGIIHISVEMPDPVLAAELTGKITASLIDYIKDYRTQKARQDMEYTRERYKEARAQFKKAQERLARFRDEHSGQLTQMARTQEELLQSEYDVAFNVYNNLAERLEQERFEVQKETPVVKVLEPATIPQSPSSTSGKLILIISLFAGFFIGLLIIVGKKVFQYIKTALNNRSLE